MTTAELKQEMRQVLEDNILRFWLDNMIDREHGGFYGRIDGHGQVHPQADKGAILNARILWAFSAAYRVLGHHEYLEAATRAKRFLIDHFIDPDYGGVYWSLDYKGEPKDTKKQFYAIGFAIYGLSEYARATGDEEALKCAMNLFECIEQHAFDAENNGYIEACTREWGPIADMRLSELDANYPKSQNTHLHIIEPYTNLYRALCEKEKGRVKSEKFATVFESEELKVKSEKFATAADSAMNTSAVAIFSLFTLHSSLSNLIHIFTDHILNPETCHLDLFFENDWTRGAGHLESYGHDIECSWLLHEAAIVLDDKGELARVEPIVLQVARASEKGLNADGSMVHEANLDTGTVDTDRHWWVQAEAVVGFINIYQHFGDEAALQKALHCWQYIKEQIIDRDGGEWLWSRHADGTPNLDDDKAGFWKCPYHNSRMCLEIIERELN